MANEIIQTRPKMAYENMDFIKSPGGRVIRMISEYEYPHQQLKDVAGTIVIFGSARTLSPEAYIAKMESLTDKLSHTIDLTDKENLQDEIQLMKRRRWLTDVYQDTIQISEMLSKWALTRPKEKQYFIATGGGPGYMEAANRGASKANAPSIGLNIAIPFEQMPNPYISPEYNFEFHYFFMRKFWFTSKSKALIVMPGGFGTLDEMTDIITLLKTKKITHRLPFVLYKRAFWEKIFNFDYLIDCGVVSKDELDYITYCETPQEVFDYLTNAIVEIEEI